MDQDLQHIHLRVSPATKARIIKAAKKAGIPVTAFGEAVFALRTKELGADADVIARGRQIAAHRVNRKT